jgi:hypothetical protein
MAQNIQLNFNTGSYGPDASFSLGAPSGTVTPSTITVSEVGAAGGSINVTVSDDSVRAITITVGGVAGACIGTQRIASWSVPTEGTTTQIATTSSGSGSGTTTSSGSGSGATTTSSGSGSGATTTSSGLGSGTTSTSSGSGSGTTTQFSGGSGGDLVEDPDTGSPIE